MPPILFASPIFRIFGEDFGPVVNRIERNAQQHEIFFHASSKTRIEFAEIIAETKTIVGQRTARVNKRHGNHFSGELRKADLLSALVDKRELGNFVSDRYHVGGLPASDFVDQAKPACRHRLLLEVLIMMDADSIGIRIVLFNDQSEVDHSSGA